ncbi:MAG: NrfD/PsrC family molybdoenzyme membrane anchor subunit [Candidatus Electryonea clarkiae]|nr:NrfD/PsrC family molybdoenzyme membrane anchor subunit [Candidatus Electryonea clarkiae]MDP8286563.1 NrfD/PsrC family molybdoenzyme membrane anchor subunit [Candidatus Electryonea clarkiae]
MKLEFTRIEGNSFEYRVMMIVFAAFAVAGALATWWVIEKGIWVTGMHNRVPWGFLIVMAIYYIGLSAGSLVISGLYGVFGKIEYKPFARIAVYVAMLFLIAGLLSIMTDQGRIDRFFVQPFVFFNLQSMFSINPMLYIGHILICILYLWALFYEKKKLTKVVATLAFGWAFCVHTGTGAIFGFGARLLYESPLLPASFVAAAMASGTALMILLIVTLFKVMDRYLDDELIFWLGRFLAITVIVVLYFLFVENAYRAYVVELRQAAVFYLFGGYHSLLFWFGLILVGLVIPLFILFNKKGGKSIRWIVLASCLVIFGVLCERYVIVIPGLIHPPELFPGMEITHSIVDEGISTYHISFLEVLQALGVMGVIGFMFGAGLKYMKLLPTEARIPKHPASADS